MSIAPSVPRSIAGHAGVTPASRPQRRRALPRWLREPLLHFVLLGGGLFAADHFINGRADDPHTILIDAAVDRQAREVFSAARGHEPNDEELYALRKVWLDNEVLYREGLALQVDKGDPAIRERVIFKALSVVDAGLKPPRYDDATLRAWFEQNRARYDEPARYDFEEAVLSGARTQAAAQDFVSALRAGAPGDVQAGLRVFKDRPQQNIVQSYGQKFATELAATQPGQWQALQSTDGWHVVRLESARPPRPAAFEALRGVVLHDWTDATMAQLRSDAVRAMTQKYTVKLRQAGEAAGPQQAAATAGRGDE